MLSARRTRRLPYKAQRKNLRRWRIVEEEDRRNQQDWAAEMRGALGKVA